MGKNFYPDFLLWLLTGGKQYVTFVAPKGIRNLEGPDGPRTRFCRAIKELSTRLGDPNVILNSFIISNATFQQVHWWTEGLMKEQFANCHVWFQHEGHKTYIRSRLTAVQSTREAAPGEPAR